MNKNVVVTVDPVITGNAFAYIAANRGYRCIEAWSSLDRMRECRRMVNHDLYDDMLVNSVHSSLIVDQLEPVKDRIAAVVAGSDSAHSIADRLAAVCQVPGNKTASSFRMNRMLLTRVIGEPCGEGYEEVHKLLLEHGVVTVKPQYSIGGYDNVSVIADISKLTETDRPMFAQPFYKGTEYAIDVVAYDGNYRLCAVWRYTKKGDSIANDRIDLVDFEKESDYCHAIFNYVTFVLETADFKNGAAHIEVMDTGTQFRLIEANFRNHGHLDLQTLYRVFDSENQVTIWANAFLTGHFEPRVAYRKRTCCRRIFVINDRPRKGKDIEDIVKRMSALTGVSKLWRQHANHEDIPIGDYTWRNVMINGLLIGKDEQELNEVEGLIHGSFK